MPWHRRQDLYTTEDLKQITSVYRADEEQLVFQNPNERKCENLTPRSKVLYVRLSKRLDLSHSAAAQFRLQTNTGKVATLLR